MKDLFCAIVLCFSLLTCSNPDKSEDQELVNENLSFDILHNQECSLLETDADDVLDRNKNCLELVWNKNEPWHIHGKEGLYSYIILPDRASNKTLQELREYGAFNNHDTERFLDCVKSDYDSNGIGRLSDEFLYSDEFSFKKAKPSEDYCKYEIIKTPDPADHSHNPQNTKHQSIYANTWLIDLLDFIYAALYFAIVFLCFIVAYYLTKQAYKYITTWLKKYFKTILEKILNDHINSWKSTLLKDPDTKNMFAKTINNSAKQAFTKELKSIFNQDMVDQLKEVIINCISQSSTESRKAIIESDINEVKNTLINIQENLNKEQLEPYSRRYRDKDEKWPESSALYPLMRKYKLLQTSLDSMIASPLFIWNHCRITWHRHLNSSLQYFRENRKQHPHILAIINNIRADDLTRFLFNKDEDEESVNNLLTTNQPDCFLNQWNSSDFKILPIAHFVSSYYLLPGSNSESYCAICCFHETIEQIWNLIKQHASNLGIKFHSLSNMMSINDHIFVEMNTKTIASIHETLKQNTYLQEVFFKCELPNQKGQIAWLLNLGYEVVENFPGMLRPQKSNVNTYAQFRENLSYS